MNKTVSLVNAWAAFEEAHPDGNIEDFCRHYLARQEKPRMKGRLVGGVVPNLSSALLLKIIGRIHKMHVSYANQALKDTGLNQIEEFGILVTIRQEKNPRKTEIIYANLFELSSGTDMLNRLKSRGLIREYDDKEDKRSKRIELTAKGEKTVTICADRIKKTAVMVMNDISDDDKELCIQLLRNTEIKLSGLWQKHKSKEFEDIYEELTGEKLEAKSKKQ